MLKRWTLSNFKSFKDRTELDLAPITVLAGANSSGKSTIIQSILLLKQTIEYVPAERAIGLNGPLLKLGRFDDIKNVGSPDSDIELSWALEDISSYRTPAAVFDRYYSYSYLRAETPKSAVFIISFTVDNAASENSDELRLLHPILDSSTCTVDYTTTEELKDSSRKTSVKISRLRKRSPTHFDAPPAARSPVFQVDNLDADAKAELHQGRPDAKVIGATATHFFPNQFGVSYNKSKNLARKISTLVSSPQYTAGLYDVDVSAAIVPASWVAFLVEKILATFSHDDEATPTLSHVVLTRARESFNSFEIREMKSNELVSELQRRMQRLDPRLRSTVRSALVESQEQLEKRFLEDTALPLDETELDLTAPRMIHYAVEQANTFFRHSIRYLGPLRDEPRPVYPLEASVNPTDVGYRGEHTAAVLNLHQDRTVEYIASSDTNKLMEAKQRTASLHVAVADWLSYLGVAESVRTADLGKIGHQLHVNTGDISKEHDLTNVGVGVSQLLPIVVMALLAPTPSLLIFEQPELHLHPKVQARLADFFIAMGLSGRQCLLETHSQYLVERLRLRIAEAEGETLNERIKVYFTQKFGGNTRCTPIEITPYGAISNWPTDFFDQSQSETERLLKAAQDKLNRARIQRSVR